MINIKFWNFAKRDNSTKQPSSTGAQTYACALKEGCSVLSPEIILTLPATTNPSSYTYAQIADFNRYYFVSGWTYNRGEWTASLKVDTLATYKAAIGNLTKYVLRSASAVNADIADTMWTTMENKTVLSSAGNSLWESGNYTIVLGVQGANPQMGGISYVALSGAVAQALFAWLLHAPGEDPETTPTGLLDLIIKDGALEEVQAQFLKAFYNPMQYLKSAMYFPFSVSGSGGSMQNWGCYGLPNAYGTTIVPTQYDLSTTTCPIPKHPQSATIGAYLKGNTYSSYVLHAEPFGDIPIDAGSVYDSESVYLEARTDFVSGQSMLTVHNGSSSAAPFLARKWAQVGVPLALGMNNVNYLGVGTSAVNAITAGIGGNYIGMAEGIGNAVMSTAPRTYSSGANGSMLATTSACVPVMTGVFAEQVSGDYADKGRPLCSTVKLNTLSGYIQCADGECDISAYESERTQISSYLTGGFFYE